jgi:valyl-tRNA synthetase
VENMFDIIQEAITSLRRAKVVIDMGNSKIEKAYIKLDTNIDKDIAKPFIQKLAKVQNVEFVEVKQDNCITDVSNNLEVYLPKGEIDMAPIINKLKKQKEKLEKEVQKLNGMLGNEKFVANAPAKVIDENKKALDEASTKLAKIEAELTTLNS